MRPNLMLTLVLSACLSLACGTNDPATAQSSLMGDTSEPAETSNTTEEDNTSVSFDDPRSMLEPSSQREEALRLGFRIIQSYFDNDPQPFIDIIADQLPQIGREGETMDGDYFRELVAHAEPYPSGEDLTMYTMEQYLDVFHPLVVTYEEAVDHFGFPPVTNGGWIPEPNDFIYFGGILQDSFSENDKFIRDGLNSFVFGERDGVWLFVGFVS